MNEITVRSSGPALVTTKTEDGVEMEREERIVLEEQISCPEKAHSLLSSSPCDMGMKTIQYESHDRSSFSPDYINVDIGEGKTITVTQHQRWQWVSSTSGNISAYRTAANEYEGEMSDPLYLLSEWVHQTHGPSLFDALQLEMNENMNE